MGQIIIPTDNKFKGPWLLDKKSLEELNERLIFIEQKLEEAFTIIVDRTAETKFEEFKRWDNEMDLEKAKKKIRDSYTSEKYDSYALLVTREGKKIKDKSLLSLIKDTQLNEYKPTELIIQITKGSCEFSLEVSTKYDGDLETRIKVMEDEIFNDINYEIHKWIENHKPNIVIQKWSSWLSILAFPIIMLILLTTTQFTKTRADIYKLQLAQECNKILKDGLTEQEINKAIEIILQQESGYVPDSFNPNIAINKTVRNIWLFSGIIFIILLIKPRTVIGLGKNKWKVTFYRNWIYFVFIFIPSSIALPIIINRLS